MTTNPSTDSITKTLRRGDPDWPTQLDDRMPDVDTLYYRGDPSLLPQVQVAITGSRACTANGQLIATGYAHQIARHDVIVTAGISFGIDARVLETAQADRIPAVGVLASGPDRPHPAAHAPMARRLADTGGCLVSLCPDGTAPRRERFRVAQRLKVALSSVLVVVEAGSLSRIADTVETARTFNVPVYATPGPVTSVQSQSTNAWIADGTARLAGERLPQSLFEHVTYPAYVDPTRKNLS